MMIMVKSMAAIDQLSVSSSNLTNYSEINLSEKLFESNIGAIRLANGSDQPQLVLQSSPEKSLPLVMPQSIPAERFDLGANVSTGPQISGGVQIRDGADPSVFEYSANDPFTRPNTAAQAPLEGPTHITLTDRVEYAEASIIAAGAGFGGYPLAGELLRHYLGNSGETVIWPLDNFGFGRDETFDSVRDRAESYLQNIAAQYFKDNPNATGVTINSPWIANDQDKLTQDEFYAFKSYYWSIRGVFTVERMPGGEAIVSGQTQVSAYKYYNFDSNPQGQDIEALFLHVSREQMIRFANPEIGLAEKFTIWGTEDPQDASFRTDLSSN